MYGLGVGESLFAYERDGISRDTIRRAADMCVNEDAQGKVRFKSVVTDTDPIETLDKLRYRLDNTEISFTDHEDHYEIKVNREIERSERTVDGSFALFKNQNVENIWTAVTGHGPDFFEKGLLWLFKRAEPDISDFYVTSDNLKSALDQLQSQFGSHVQIKATKTVAYSRTEEGNISHETNPYPEAFRRAEKNNRDIDKIRFVAVRQDNGHKILLKAFLTRNGQMKFLGGNVGLFFDTLLPMYAEFGQNKTDIFSDKQRSRETGDIHEIELEFEEQVFQNTDDNDHLIEALANLRKSNVTVYHNNPYAHISVLDAIDGSSCDVLITGPSEISIVPSYRSSLNSLMRIAEQISREFDEGIAHEAQKAEYEFSDFF